MNVQTVTFNDLSFISVTNPGELEIKYLKNNFGFDMLHLEDYINKTQIPKIEAFKNYSLVVLDFPYYNVPSDQMPQSSLKTSQDKQNHHPKPTLTSMLPVPLPSITSYFSSVAEIKRKRLLTTQVYFFIGQNYLVVLHEGVLVPITTIFAECQKSLRNRNEYMSQGTVYLAYRIMDALVDSCFPIMNGIASTIDKIDKELEGKGSEETIEDITLTRRNIVLFQTIVKPMRPLFAELESGKYKELNGSMTPFWGNVFDHLQRMWERLEDSRELIEGISESNESLLSYRNNELVKFFTVITSISFPFVIVNNLYSMNVANLPYAHSDWIIWILFGIIFCGGVAIILYFKHRKWL